MPESKQTTVLVVDDEALTQTVVRDILSSHGYLVVIAADGIEGVREIHC